MTSDATHDELLARARELREQGRSPKQIGRALGVRPATATRLVRALAQNDTTPVAGRAVVGCWVNRGWSVGLGVSRDWPDSAEADGLGGLAGVGVARRYSPGRVSVCGYLVDVYCLGVKNALGPEVMDDGDLPGFRQRLFAPFGAEVPLQAPLDLARHLVWGAVDYARQLGFEPHPDFQDASEHLGPWEETSAITFGQDGVPFYVSGPYDDPSEVMRTLSQSVGEGNFHFLA